jgi:hypothetical protein
MMDDVGRIGFIPEAASGRPLPDEIVQKRRKKAKPLYQTPQWTGVMIQKSDLS